MEWNVKARERAMTSLLEEANLKGYRKDLNNLLRSFQRNASDLCSCLYRILDESMDPFDRDQIVLLMDAVEKAEQLVILLADSRLPNAERAAFVQRALLVQSQYRGVIKGLSLIIKTEPDTGDSPVRIAS